MSQVETGANSGAKFIYTKTYRVAIGSAVTTPFEYADLLATEEASLSAAAAVSVINGKYTFDASHDTASLGSTFVPTYAALVVNEDLAIINLQEFTQPIDPNSTLDTKFVIAVTYEV